VIAPHIRGVHYRRFEILIPSPIVAFRVQQSGHTTRRKYSPFQEAPLT